MLAVGYLTRNWWAFVLRGVIAILFGIVALVQPSMTLVALVLLFAIWAFVDGVLALIHSVGAMLGFRLKGLAGRLPAPVR